MKLKQAIFIISLAMVAENTVAIENKSIFTAIKSNTSSINESSKFYFDETPTDIGEKSLKDDDLDKELKIRINRGRKFTNKKEIEVEIRPIKLSATLVSKMKIGFKPDLSDAEWEPFKFNKFLDIPNQEGEVVVYASLKDKAGNNSPIERAKIIVDTTPPTDASVVINKGAEFSGDSEMRVRLSLSATDAYKMQISNSGQFDNSEWEDFVPERYWMLGPKVEGKKVIYVRFADRAANITEPITSSIIVDLTPPDGKVVINKGDRFTNSRKVTLNIFSDDAAVVRIVGPGIQNIPYQKTEEDGSLTKTWQLDSIEGQKFVKVFFRDNAGNISKRAIVDDIFLDTSAPQIGLFKINQGERYCIHKEGKVTLQIGTREDPNTFSMMVSNRQDFSDAKKIQYKPKIENWQLDNESDGIKTVYLKFIDKAGNESKTAMSKVILDRTPPFAKSMTIDDGAKWVNSGYSTLKFTVEGADLMEVSNSPKFSQLNGWEDFSSSKQNWILPARDGNIKVYARFKDKAGNISEVITTQILKDTQSPSGKITINNNARFSNDKSKTVDLTLKYDDDAYQMQISNSTQFSNTGWTSVVNQVNDWKLEGEDGEKRIFVRFKDRSENISDIFASGIVLDTEPPLYPTISINGDSIYVGRMDKMVNLEFGAEDAMYMMIATSPDFKEAKWESFARGRKFVLPGTDGEKQVFVKYKDEAGNISETVSDKIILDRYPPKPIEFIINNGEEWTNDANKSVTLSIKSENATMMIIADNAEFNNADWQPYSNKVENYTLNGEDGMKSLFIAFKDDAGNKSGVLSATIKLKRSF